MTASQIRALAMGFLSYAVSARVCVEREGGWASASNQTVAKSLEVELVMRARSELAWRYAGRLERLERVGVDEQVAAC